MSNAQQRIDARQKFPSAESRPGDEAVEAVERAVRDFVLEDITRLNQFNELARVAIAAYKASLRGPVEAERPLPPAYDPASGLSREEWYARHGVAERPALTLTVRERHSLMLLLDSTTASAHDPLPELENVLSKLRSLACLSVEEDTE